MLGGAPRRIHEGGFAWSVSPDGSLIAFTSTSFDSDIWLIFLGFREALFLGADAPVLTAKVSGALPEAAVGTLVGVNLAAEDGVLFWDLSFRVEAKMWRTVKPM